MDHKDSFDIPSLRDVLTDKLGEHAAAYPRQIEQHFPHILAKLANLWGKPEADRYLDSLTMPDRPGRRGFPEEAARELFKLSMIHSTLQSAKGVASRDGWSSAESSEVDDFFSRRSNR